MCKSCGNPSHISDDDYVHLHVHSGYSLLDGHADFDVMMKHIKDIGQSAISLTDHGSMYGVMDFIKAANKYSIKPIIGMEGYLALASAQRQDKELDRKSYHLLMLAQNYTGYQNLMKLTTKAWNEGFYHRPRNDKEQLLTHSDGLIVSSGCLGAELPSMILRGATDQELSNTLNWWKEAFPNRFYLELQRRLTSVDQHQVNKKMVELSKIHNVPLIATTDAHYVMQGDAGIHDLKLCIQTGAYQSDEKRMKFDEDTYYLTETALMTEYFKEVPSAIINTRMIADMCNVEMPHEGYHLPIYPVPNGYNAETFLRMLCNIGVSWRYGSQANEEEVQKRLNYELDIINRMNFNAYFLLVWDLCEYARDADIWWNVRGSGAGSLVAYALGITGIDPLAHGLYFERFLNPDRISMPDIDLDFPDNRRDELVKYLVLKYGDDRVAGIITFGTMGARAAVKDVGRALHANKGIVDRFAALMPKNATIAEALQEDRIIEYMKQHPELYDVVNNASEIEGSPRHTSVHAAGFVVTPKAMDEYIPMTKLTKGQFVSAGLKLVTQFPMAWIDEMRLLKIDLLGLSTLSAMSEACRVIAERHGEELNIDNIPYKHTGDKDADARLDEAFALLGRGETAGVFQVENSGLTQMMRLLKPKLFDHIVAMISLYRPGPMGVDAHNTYVRRLHGEEETSYLHEKLEPILSETYGLIVYQEQIMRIASELFGYTPGEADQIRKAVSKKKLADMEKHEQTFLKNGPLNGIPEETARLIWAEIAYFANYGFNKAHASDYAKICMQTAFLKAQYPVEYMYALMTSYSDKPDKLAKLSASCQEMGLVVLSPSVNESHDNFTIISTVDSGGNKVEGVQFGFTQVKGCGSSQSAIILEARNEKIFNSFADFMERVNIRSINRNSMEAWIKVGVFDVFGDRDELLNALDKIRDYSASTWKSIGHVKQTGQMSLFGEESVQPILLSQFVDKRVERSTDRERLEWEKELLGMYITARPTDRYRQQFARRGAFEIAEIIGEEQGYSEYEGTKVTIAGEIKKLRVVTDRKGRKMAFLSVEDFHSSQKTIDITVFSSLYEKLDKLVTENSIILTSGKVDSSRGSINILADNIILADDLEN